LNDHETKLTCFRTDDGRPHGKAEPIACHHIPQDVEGLVGLRVYLNHSNTEELLHENVYENSSVLISLFIKATLFGHKYENKCGENVDNLDEPCRNVLQKENLLIIIEPNVAELFRF